MAMMFRVLIVFLSFNIIVNAFSGSGGGGESMMNDICQTMALSMFAYELPKVPDKDISFPRSAPLLLQPAESSLGMDSTECVGKPFKGLNIPDKNISIPRLAPLLSKAAKSSLRTDSTIYVGKTFKELHYTMTDMNLGHILNHAGKEKEISDRIKSLSNIKYHMNLMNPYKRDILDDIKPYKDSDEKVKAMKLEDLPNDAGSMKEICDRIESLSNIIHDMNHYEREIFENSRVELIKVEISHSRVYAIVNDKRNKRVLVAFRGTQSPSDIYRDAKLIFKNIPDPTSGDSSQQIGVHTGFLDALIGGEIKQGKTGKNAYKDGHIAKTVKRLRLIEKGYRLYVTGHSLGGAMATLFGFFAASDDYFVQNGSVTIYSYASPRVGDSYFGDAFRVLEMKNRLRHGRIGNRGDVVVRLPYYFGRYKHVGLGVELLGDKKSGKSPKFEFPEKTVPRVYDSKPRFLMKAPMSGGVGDTIRNTIVFPLNWIKREHSTNLMFDRLKSWRETFERTTLEQLYEEFCHRYPSS